MIVLAFDTAMASCSAAVVRCADGDSRILGQIHETRTRGHAEVLAPMIAQVMADAGVAFADLDRIAVTTGPGTFTGVRIGVATARGIAVASGLPVAGVTTLKAVAAGAAKHRAVQGRAIAPVFDARRGEVYVQCFSDTLDALTRPQVLGYDEAWRAVREYRPILAGTGAGLLPVTDEAAAGSGALPDQPTAAIIAELGAAGGISADPVVPLYLRAPDAKLPS